MHVNHPDHWELHSLTHHCRCCGWEACLDWNSALLNIYWLNPENSSPQMKTQKLKDRRKNKESEGCIFQLSIFHFILSGFCFTLIQQYKRVCLVMRWASTFFQWCFLFTFNSLIFPITFWSQICSNYKATTTHRSDCSESVWGFKHSKLQNR